MTGSQRMRRPSLDESTSSSELLGQLALHREAIRNTTGLIGATRPEPGGLSQYNGPYPTHPMTGSQRMRRPSLDESTSSSELLGQLALHRDAFNNTTGLILLIR